MFKLLVALDGTRHAQELLDKVKVLPTPGELEVVLHHCLDLNSLDWPDGRNSYNEQIEAGQKRCQAYLDLEVGRLRELGYGQVRTQLRLGHPRQSILEVAKDENVDAIVLQTHGRSGLEWLFMGSVAEGVIRRSSCPVIVLPADPKADPVVGSLIL